MQCSADPPIYVFLVFICFNITFNMLTLYVFKHGSSTLFVIANAVRLPIVAILLMWHAVAGASKQGFTHYDGFALVMLVVAVLVYYSQKEGEKERAPGGGGGGEGGDAPLLGGNVPQLTRASFTDVIGRTRSEASDGSRSHIRGDSHGDSGGGGWGSQLEDGLLGGGSGGSGGSAGRGGTGNARNRRLDALRDVGNARAGRPGRSSSENGGDRRYNFSSFDGGSW